MEPEGITPLDTMRAYERASFQPHISDLEICRHIDRKILPRLGLTSYTKLNNGQKQDIVQELQQTYHTGTEQIYRCLGGSQTSDKKPDDNSTTD